MTAARALLQTSRSRLVGVRGWWGLPFVVGGLVVNDVIRRLLGASGYHAEILLGVAVLVVLCLLPLAQDAWARRLDVFELGTGFRLLYFLYFGVRTLGILLGVGVPSVPTWAAWPPQVLVATTTHPSVILAGLPRAIWYADLGMAAYQIGYGLPLARPWLRTSFIHRKACLDTRLLTGAAGSLYVLGFLSRVPALTHGWFMDFAANRYHVPAAVQTVSFFSILSIIGFALACVALYAPGSSRTLPLITLVVIVPLEVAYAFLFGSKFYFMLLLCIPIITYHYLRRRISLAVILAVIVVFVFAVGPVVSAYRIIAQNDSLSLRSFGREIPSVVKGVATQLMTRPIGGFVTASVQASLARFAGIEGIAAVVRGIPLIMGYAHGATLAWVVKILVPTVLWPTKYAALNHTLDPVPHLYGFPDFTMGGIAITEVAELYWNFGVAGILVGMGLVGMLQQILVAWLIRPPSPLSVFLYSVIWPLLMLSVESWFYAIYSNVFRFLGMTLAIAGVVFWISHRRQVSSVPDAPAIRV